MLKKEWDISVIATNRGLEITVVAAEGVRYTYSAVWLHLLHLTRLLPGFVSHICSWVILKETFQSWNRGQKSIGTLTESSENGAASALVPEEKMAPGCCRLLSMRAPRSALWNAVQKLGRLWPEHLQQPAFFNAHVPTVPGNCFLTLRRIYKRWSNFSNRAPERKTLSSAFVEFIPHWLNDLGKSWKTRLPYLVFLLSYLTDWWLIYLSLKLQHLKLWRKRKVPMNYHALLCLLLRR